MVWQSSFLCGMKRVYRIVAAVFALCFLAAWFFNGMSIAGSPEMMTWEEFSTNPRSVDRFRQRVSQGESWSPEMTRHAYEAYVAQVQQRSAAAAGLQSGSDGRIDELKGKWRRVYRVFVPGKFRSKKVNRAFWTDENRERLGMAITFVVLVGAIGVFTFAIRVTETRARA
jgi:hypothetical protein